MAPAARYPFRTTDGLAWFCRTSKTMPLGSTQRETFSGPGRERRSSRGKDGGFLAIGRVPGGKVEADDSLRGPQVLPSDTLDVVGRHRRPPLQGTLEPRKIGEHLAVAEPERL